MISGELRGDFNGAAAIRSLHAETPRHAKAMAQWTVDWVRTHVTANALGLSPARGKWAERKSGNVPLIDTRAYISSLTVRRVNATTFSAGPAPQFAQRASWLEFGMRTYPARPHWRPAAAAAEGKAKDIAGDLESKVGDALRRR